MLSVLEVPVSDAVARSRFVGAAGAVVSMVTDNAADAALTLPAVSVALAVMLRVPAARAEVVVMDHCPAVATPVPTAVVPSYSVTVAPASAVPVKVGLVTSVMLSVVDTPLSEAASRSGAEGAAGANTSGHKF